MNLLRIASQTDGLAVTTTPKAKVGAPVVPKAKVGTPVVPKSPKAPSIRSEPHSPKVLPKQKAKARALRPQISNVEAPPPPAAASEAAAAVEPDGARETEDSAAEEGVDGLNDIAVNENVENTEEDGGEAEEDMADMGIEDPVKK